MRRAAGPPTATKAQPKSIKPNDSNKTSKRPQKKTVPSTLPGTGKKKPVATKPGFTLYSANGKVAAERQGKSDNPKTESTSREDVKRTEPAMPSAPDITSQIQLQEAKEKALQAAASLHIPTAGPEESVNQSDQDDYIGGTPFNKRLVSSTPDPERLREVELQERLTGPSEEQRKPPRFQDNDDLQLIPERDAVAFSSHDPGFSYPMDTLTSVASGLSEKIKQQRESAKQFSRLPNGSHEERRNLHKQKVDQAVPKWKQKHKLWEEELQRYQSDATSSSNASASHGGDGMSTNIVSMSAEKSNPPPPYPMTKAEWVTGKQPLHSPRTQISKPTTLAKGENILHSFNERTLAAKANTPIENTRIGAPLPERTVPNSLTSKVKMSLSSKVLDNKENPPGTNMPVHVPDHYKDYETFKQGILQTKNSAFKEPVSQHNGFQESAYVVSLSPVLTTVAVTYSHDVKVASSYSHNTMVTSSGNNLKVSEAVIGSHLDYKSEGSSFVPKRNIQHNENLDVDEGEKANYGASQEESKKIQPMFTNVQEINPQKTFQKHAFVSSIPSSKIKSDNTPGLDSSVDSCDLEVRSVNSNDKSNAKGTDDQNYKTTSKAAEVYALEDTSFLSGVINMLKADVFNNQAVATNLDQNELERVPTNNSPGDIQPKEKQVKPASQASEGLQEIMALYMQSDRSELASSQKDTGIFSGHAASAGLSDSSQKETNTKPDKDVEAIGETRSDNKDKPGTEVAAGADLNRNNSSTGKAGETDLNQNYNNYSSDEYDSPRAPKRGRNLLYLESMADPTLKEIACRLAFKATALRDVELRDLIDDMIFHTDAALGHEGARYQSKQLFLQEENNKLKKRLHNVNRQLDAKERQEKMAATSVYTNNDMLQLERKLVYLRQEKDRLDHQVTALLEDKSKWLITQQDLVKTISLKDHEILKLEERHQQDITRLHQNLNQATQNSQGVHYKLSVADREISNMEQRLKCRDLDIADLREKQRQAEIELGECRQHLASKDQEMLRLQDLVDTLKMGVDNVLHLYETGPSGQPPTPQQRQGIDNLRRMAHPEMYMTNPGSSRRGVSPIGHTTRQKNVYDGMYQLPPAYSQPMPETQPNHYDHHHSGRHHSYNGMDRPPRSQEPPPIRPQPRYPPPPAPDWGGVRPELEPPPVPPPVQVPVPGHQTSQRHSSRGHGGKQFFSNVPPERLWDSRSMRSDLLLDDIDDTRLTPAALQEHNERLSPVDRRLWRSMNDQTAELAAEPYHSDSEYELHQRNRRRSSRRSRTPKSILKKRDGAEVANTGQIYPEEVNDGGRLGEGWEDGRQRVRRKSESDKFVDAGNMRHRLSRSLHDDGMIGNRVDYYDNKFDEHPQRDAPVQERNGGGGGSQTTKYSSLRSEPVSHHSSFHSISMDDLSTLEEGDIDDNREVSIVRGHISQGGAGLADMGSDMQSRPKTPPHYSTPRSQQRSVRGERRTSSSSENNSTLHSVFNTLQPDSSTRRSQYQSPSRDSRYQSPSRDSHYQSPSRDSYMGFEKRSKSRSTNREVCTSCGASGLESYSRSKRGVRESNYPPQSSPVLQLSDISVSRRATMGEGDNVTQRDFFQGTQLSASVSSIEDDNYNAAAYSNDNNNELSNFDEHPFSTGIASLDIKIANLQKKINRAKAIFS